MEYARRTVDGELDDLLSIAPAVAIDGAKGVGKTATAIRRASRTWLLDDPAQRSLLGADPAFVTAGPGTLLIDEWQRLPQVWDSVRRRVDDGAPPGRFILTGSATPRAGVDTHSGAGRIVSVRMRPMAFHERHAAADAVSLRAVLGGVGERLDAATDTTIADYFAAIESSGFPGIAGQPERLRRGLLDAYIDRVIDRELPDHGVAVRRPETLRRWLAAYASASSTTTALTRLAAAAAGRGGDQPAKTTTMAYRDHLTQLWLLDPVPGWSPSRNPMSRLQQAPKHQLADPALAARLLHLSAAALASARGAHMAGRFFESLVTLSVRVAAQAAEASVGHLRTGNGDHEVDLIVEGVDGGVVGIEVKMGVDVDDADVRHLRWLREQLRDDVVDLLVVTAGRYAYRRADGIGVVPLALLGA